MKTKHKYILFALIIGLYIIGLSLVSYDYWQKILVWDTPDQDDQLRILQVRAWLEGQAFYDVSIHRSNPPDGGAMHWSRIADIPLAIFELIFKPFSKNYEYLGVFFAPLAVGLVFLFIGKELIKSLSDYNFNLMPYALFLTLIFYSESINYNFRPSRVDHHGLQLACLLAIILGLAVKGFKGGIISALGLSISLTIGFELLPIEILCVFYFVLAWIIAFEDYSKFIKGFCLSLIIFIICGLFINIAPSKIFIGANDALSIAQVTPICIGAFLLFIANNYAKTIRLRLISSVIIGIIVIISALQFEVLFKPLYWQLDPLVEKLLYTNISEMLPLRMFPLDMIIIIISLWIAALLTGIYKINKLLQTNSKLIIIWVLMLVLLLATSLMTIFYQFRVHTQASCIAIIILGAYLIERVSKRQLTFILLIVNIIYPIKLIAYGINELGPNKTIALQKCNNARDLTHFKTLEKGLLVGNLDIGVPSLISSELNVVSTSFHRDKGNIKAYNILTSNTKDAQNEIKKLGIDYVAFCNKSKEVSAIIAYAPNGLLSDLAKGNIPNYLAPIAKPQNSDVYIYKVK